MKQELANEQAYIDQASLINNFVSNTLSGLDTIVNSLVERDKDDKFLKPEERINNALYIVHCLYKQLVGTEFHQEDL